MNETAPNICWHDDGGSRCSRHRDGEVIPYGRCRSGRRWFWAAVVVGADGDSAYGWTDTERGALDDARAAVVRLANGKPTESYLRHGYASHKLKEVNAAKRAQRPAKGDGDAVQREFLYGVYGGGEESDPCIVPYQITKRTPKRVYYVRGERWNRDRTAQVPDIGFVDRQELEEKGEVHNGGVHWSSPDWHLYVVPPELEQHRQAAPDLVELKASMAAAHPDRGGMDAEFIAARERYERARRRAKVDV